MDRVRHGALNSPETTHDALMTHGPWKTHRSVCPKRLRQGEVEGKDYFFLTKEEFEEKIRRGELVEWERYPNETHGQYYGTLKSEVDRALTTGRLMLFDVDVKGALSIKRLYGNDAVLIFIEPPSMEILSQRLLGRRTEDEVTVQHRLNRVPMEMELGRMFEYHVVNDKLEDAIAAVAAIIDKHMETERIHQ
jgi:guanylate kinase